MNKKLVGGVIMLLLVLTVVGAGCTSSPTTTSPSPLPTTAQTTQISGSSQASPTATSTTHDALLEKLAAAERNTTGNLTVTSWDVQWVNSTTVNIQASGSDQKNNTWSMNDTFMRFPSNDAATAYLQTFNRSGYKFYSRNATTDDLYYTATGRLPTVFQYYVNLLNDPGQIIQMDDVIKILDMKVKLQ